MSSPLPVLRPAIDGDAENIAVIHRVAFHAALPWIPTLHTPAEDRAFFLTVVSTQNVVVAEVEGEPVGFAAWADSWLNHLYVVPEHQGYGVGKALLAKVIATHRDSTTPATFSLWTFQRNFRARRFYQSHGLVPVEFTPGDHNEEREPDMRLLWRSWNS